MGSEEQPRTACSLTSRRPVGGTGNGCSRHRCFWLRTDSSHRAQFVCRSRCVLTSVGHFLSLTHPAFPEPFVLNMNTAFESHLRVYCSDLVRTGNQKNVCLKRNPELRTTDEILRSALAHGKLDRFEYMPHGIQT